MLSLNHIKITPRDEQVLQLLMQGCSNKEIAAQLNISPRTVKQHLRTLSATCPLQAAVTENGESREKGAKPCIPAPVSTFAPYATD
jgi:FixJ family two-component response regulator